MAPGFHFQSGVARASSRELPSMVKEEPRKRRRARVTSGRPWVSSRREIPRLARNDEQNWNANSGSFAGDLGEGARDDACAFFHGDDFIHGDVFEAIDLATGPGDFERIDFCALGQAEMDARIVRGHVAHAAFGLFDLDEIAGS